MEKIKMILDVDTGSDDAIAIVSALLSPEIEVLGITTVTGNVNIENTTDNTLRVVQCCGKPEVGVYRGAALPMVSTLVPWGLQAACIPRPNREPGALSVHPDHLPLPEASFKEQPKRAVSWIIDTLLAQEDNSVVLCPVGPMTNIGLALRADERIIKKIKKVVMMGGTHNMCAPTQAAEFNVWCDPEALEVVLQSGLEVTMVSLDATAFAMLNEEQAAAIRAVGTEPAKFVASMIENRLAASAAMKKEEENGDSNVGAAIHDALAVCAAVHPEVLTRVEHTSCHVDLGRGFAYGDTVIGRNYKMETLPKNCYYAWEADSGYFFNWLLDILKNA